MLHWLIHVVHHRQNKWFLSLLFLIIILQSFFPSKAFSVWIDVTSSTNLNKTRLLYNFDAKVSYLDGSLSNISVESFQAPIRLVIDTITPSQVTVQNADGLTEDGKPYFDFSELLGDGILAPDETSTARQLDFYNPDRLRFNFNINMGWFAIISEDSRT